MSIDYYYGLRNTNESSSKHNASLFRRFIGFTGGANNFCLQKSRMPTGRIGIFLSFMIRPLKIDSMLPYINDLLMAFPLGKNYL